MAIEPDQNELVLLTIEVLSDMGTEVAALENGARRLRRDLRQLDISLKSVPSAHVPSAKSGEPLVATALAVILLPKLVPPFLAVINAWLQGREKRKLRITLPSGVVLESEGAGLPLGASELADELMKRFPSKKESPPGQLPAPRRVSKKK